MIGSRSNILGRKSNADMVKEVPDRYIWRKKANRVWEIGQRAKLWLCTVMTKYKNGRIIRRMLMIKIKGKRRHKGMVKNCRTCPGPNSL